MCALGCVLHARSAWNVTSLGAAVQAYEAFTEDQRAAILRHCADIAHAPIDTIEQVGGGGVRCTIAELF